MGEKLETIINVGLAIGCLATLKGLFWIGGIKEIETLQKARYLSKQRNIVSFSIDSDTLYFKTNKKFKLEEGTKYDIKISTKNGSKIIGKYLEEATQHNNFQEPKSFKKNYTPKD